MSVIAALLLSIGIYQIAIFIQKRVGLSFLHPLLLSALIIMLLLSIFNIPYESYNEGAKFISAMVGPATVSLAIPLYKNLAFLKTHIKPILIGVFFGVVFHAFMILGFAFIFSFDKRFFVTVLPHSVTTAIAAELAENYGGFKELTTAMVILTGVLGASLASPLFKFFKIKSPLAQGIALGTAAHAVGTSKAVELGVKQASAASVALILSGIITVILMPLFIQVFIMIV